MVALCGRCELLGARATFFLGQINKLYTSESRFKFQGDALSWSAKFCEKVCLRGAVVVFVIVFAIRTKENIRGASLEQLQNDKQRGLSATN